MRVGLRPPPLAPCGGYASARCEVRPPLSYAKKNKFGFIKLIAVSLRCQTTQTPCPMSLTSLSPVTSRKVQHLVDLALTFGIDCVTSDAEFSELSVTEQMLVLESL